MLGLRVQGCLSLCDHSKRCLCNHSHHLLKSAPFRWAQRKETFHIEHLSHCSRRDVTRDTNGRHILSKSIELLEEKPLRAQWRKERALKGKWAALTEKERRKRKKQEKVLVQKEEASWSRNGLHSLADLRFQEARLTEQDLNRHEVQRLFQLRLFGLILSTLWSENTMRKADFCLPPPLFVAASTSQWTSALTCMWSASRGFIHWPGAPEPSLSPPTPSTSCPTSASLSSWWWAHPTL